MAVANHVEEGAMHPGIVRKFGMVCGSPASSLPDCDGITALGGNYFYVRSHALNFGGTDKNHLQRGVSQFAGADGAVDLASVGVASNSDVERAQARLLGIFNFVGQKDCARARAKRRFNPNEVFQLFKSCFPEQVQESSTFATGDDQAVDLFQLLRLLDEDDFSAQLFEPFAVRIEIPLQSKYADFHKRPKQTLKPQRARRYTKENPESTWEPVTYHPRV